MKIRKIKKAIKKSLGLPRKTKDKDFVLFKDKGNTRFRLGEDADLYIWVSRKGIQEAIASYTREEVEVEEISSCCKPKKGYFKELQNY